MNIGEAMYIKTSILGKYSEAYTPFYTHLELEITT